MSSYWVREILNPDSLFIIVACLYVLIAVIIHFRRKKRGEEMDESTFFIKRIRRREEIQKRGGYAGPFKLNPEGNVIRNFDFWFGLSIFFVIGFVIIVVTIIKIKFDLPRAEYNPMWDFVVGFVVLGFGTIILLWPNIMKDRYIRRKRKGEEESQRFN